MELSELTTATLEIFECKTPDDLPTKIKKCVDELDFEKYQAFKELVGDLENDWHVEAGNGDAKQRRKPIVSRIKRCIIARFNVWKNNTINRHQKSQGGRYVG